MVSTTKIYSNTVAKYNEGKLLSEEKLRRLADADFDSAVKMLLDYGYAGVGGKGSFDVDALITAQTEKLIEFIEDDCFDEHTAAVLLARFYYNNAKTRYKYKLGAQRSEGALFVMRRDCTLSVTNSDYSQCPPAMSAALAELDEKAVRNSVSAREVDEVLTRAMYADMLANAKKAGKAVVKFVRAKIDFVNLTSALRCLRAGSDVKEFLSSFIEGGTVSEDDLTDAFLAGIDGFADKLRDTEYYELLKKVSEKGFDALAAFESDAAEAENTFFEGDLENMTSSAPLLHYYAAAMNEFKTVRIILTCIKNGVKDEIPKRVRWS